ncbi:hypothetical protein ADUPG1_005748, partial [Aduncisulcus paluster]
DPVSRMAIGVLETCGVNWSWTRALGLWNNLLSLVQRNVCSSRDHEIGSSSDLELGRDRNEMAQVVLGQSVSWSDTGQSLAYQDDLQANTVANAGGASDRL